MKMLASVTKIRLRLCLHYECTTTVEIGAYKILLCGCSYTNKAGALTKVKQALPKKPQFWHPNYVDSALHLFRLLRSILLLAAIFTSHIVLLLVFFRLKSCVSTKPYRIHNIEFSHSALSAQKRSR